MFGEMLVGNVGVLTTHNRGFTAEEIADRALDKIVYVGQNSHPAIREQAEAFREQIKGVLLYYLKEMAENERVTIASKLRDAGHPELVNIL